MIWRPSKMRWLVGDFCISRPNDHIAEKWTSRIDSSAVRAENTLNFAHFVGPKMEENRSKFYKKLEIWEMVSKRGKNCLIMWNKKVETGLRTKKGIEKRTKIEINWKNWGLKYFITSSKMLLIGQIRSKLIIIWNIVQKNAWI